MTDPTNPAPPAEELRGKQALVELANTRMNLSLERWGHLCGAILADLDHLSVLTVENERMREALERCRDQFQFYADEHNSAGKLEKAATNQGYADIARAALSSLPAMKGEG